MAACAGARWPRQPRSPAVIGALAPGPRRPGSLSWEPGLQAPRPAGAPSPRARVRPAEAGRINRRAFGFIHLITMDPGL